jgi:hypothetical protein
MKHQISVVNYKVISAMTLRELQDYEEDCLYLLSKSISDYLRDLVNADLYTVRKAMLLEFNYNWMKGE